MVAEDGEAATWKEASFNFYDKRLLGGAWMKQQDPELIKQFCRILAVCHTAIPDGELATMHEHCLGLCRPLRQLLSWPLLLMLDDTHAPHLLLTGHC